MRPSLTGGDVPVSGLGRWLYALKPASWPKLLVPALLGQVLGASGGRGLDLRALGWGLSFTVLGLGFIVLLILPPVETTQSPGPPHQGDQPNDKVDT